MNDNERIAGVMLDLLEKGIPFVLVSITALDGSSPRHKGAKMVVDARGKSHGTIGGSLLEATAIKESQVALSAGRSRLLRFSLAGQDAGAPGMICGGKDEVLLDYVPVTAENLSFFRRWHEAVYSGSNFYFLTHLKPNGDLMEAVGHSIVNSHNEIFSTCPLTQPEISHLQSGISHIAFTSTIEMNDTRVIVDPIRKVKTAFCFGAGHVAVPTVQIASIAGFRVVITDDRAEFANQERFPEASQVYVIADYNHAMDQMDIDEDSFIVIFTRGHQFDREVLEQALKTHAGYIGMISSRKKKEAIYNALMAKGVSKADLDRVHSPIGLPIGGETPEEIAVSIVAEMISVRAQQQE